MEELYVEEILKAIRKNPKLKVTILLDRSRGLRYSGNKNSNTMLKKLLSEVKIIQFIIFILLFLDLSFKSKRENFLFS